MTHFRSLQSDTGSRTSGPNRTVVGFFNWNEKEPVTLKATLEQLELDPSKRHVGFDYWANRFIAPVDGSLTVSLGGAACRVISLYPQRDHPQLVSTSRHITQGIVDVITEQWDGAECLSGSSRVVKGDIHELRIVVPARPGDWKVKSALTVGATNVKWSQEGLGVRVAFLPAETGELKWEVRFER